MIEPPAQGIAPPNNLTAFALSDCEVKLAWSKSIVQPTRVLIERADSTLYEWAEIAELSGFDTVFIDNRVSEGRRYSYRIFFLIYDLVSDPSKSVGVIVPPIAPRLSSVCQITDTPLQIELRWIDSSRVETGYEIQRRLSSDQVYSILAATNPDATVYLDSNLVAGRTYIYRIHAQFREFASLWSEEASITVNWFPPNTPVIRDGRFIRPRGVRLSWEIDSSQTGASIAVERREPPSMIWIEVARVPGVLRECVDTTVVFNTTYSYRLYAFRDGCQSGYSDTVTVTIPSATLAPPSDLVARDLKFNSVTLAWTDNSDDESGFRLQRRDDNSFIWQYIAEAGRDSTSLSDSAVNLLTTYYYRICAISEDGNVESPWSPELEVTTRDGPPATPQRFKAKCFDMKHVLLTWEMGSKNNQMFLIERRLAGQRDDQFILWAGTDSNKVSYIDRDVDQDVLYCYRIRSVNLYGVSGYSNLDSTAAVERAFFYDDFESYSVGKLPKSNNWSVDADSGASILVEEGVSASGRKALGFHRPVDDDSSLIRLHLSYNDTLLVERVRFKLLLPQTGRIFISGLSSEYATTFRITFNSDGTITLQRNWQPVVVGDYPLGEWFSLEILADNDLNSYSLSINGRVLISNERMGSTDLQRGFEISTGRDEEFHGLYVDDIEVRR